MESKSEVTLYEKIDTISKKIGLEDSGKTILEVATTDNLEVKEVHLKSGTWEDGEPWFVIDENKKLHALVSIDTLTKMINSLKNLNQDNFDLKLERTIWQHFPIDFGDVWVVAMDEIKNMAKKSDKAHSVKIDLNKLVSDIKKKYPSLFIDINAIHNNMMKLNKNAD